MAKNKKPAKATKKPVAKAKSAPKTKKVASAKKAPKKKDVSKKTGSTKGASKKDVAKKKTAPKIPLKKATSKLKGSDSKQESITKTITPKSIEKAMTPKMPLSQMNMFQMPTQRPIAHKPPTPSSTKDERSRYSEDELKEFESLINSKLAKAREEYRILKETLNRNNDEGTDATSGGNTKVLEDGAETAEKENLSQLAARQQKYITNLENALVRIKNGTYGICSVTGKLISKERLIAVPHTTQSIEAKMMQQD
jgi:RNA polymerase-binding transcription factor DksA